MGNMDTILVRLLKRKTSLEIDDIEEVCRTEFKRQDGDVDLNVSTYRIADTGEPLLQMQSEHAASLLSPPCRHHSGLDVGGCGGDEVITEGDTAFAFTRNAHRELLFRREEELLLFVAGWLADRRSRKRTVERESVRRYVRERLTTGDEEWVRCCDARPKWREWAISRPVDKPAP